MRQYHLSFLFFALLVVFSLLFLILGIVEMDLIFAIIALLCMTAAWLAYKEFGLTIHYIKKTKETVE
ncbi:hypothetical protein IAE19_04025 [Acinetobacter sp. S40]|uniref:hypothetical protein n=1 Tax=unclassified Acinetobacter TaxID=196816 RepID=UPI001909BE1E|nr:MULTISPECIES: hypothetical protein [unclassified Acinetobacter]MBJ9984608.1 hypothetical protein [Acinetobacter sp. S40]MBK0062325.1 hypothetical protein [Acinetobacter sp. S55]MBK0066129.1 hypothetical protein [Acinetobacter sp. S54]